MKKIISILIAVMMMASAFSMATSAEEQTGDYYLSLLQVGNNMLFVNGIGTQIDENNHEIVPVQDEEGNILVPLRMVVGTVGGWIDWVEETDSVIINYNGVDISFVMNSSEVKVGDETVKLSVAPYTIQDRTVVPLDFFTECMKGNTQFDKETNTIMLAFLTKVYAAG